jgi:hypothetical protein
VDAGRPERPCQARMKRGVLTTLCLKPFMTATCADAPWAVQVSRRHGGGLWVRQQVRSRCGWKATARPAPIEEGGGRARRKLQQSRIQVVSGRHGDMRRLGSAIVTAKKVDGSTTGVVARCGVTRGRREPRAWLQPQAVRQARAAPGERRGVGRSNGRTRGRCQQTVTVCDGWGGNGRRRAVSSIRTSRAARASKLQLRGAGDLWWCEARHASQTWRETGGGERGPARHGRSRGAYIDWPAALCPFEQRSKFRALANQRPSLLCSAATTHHHPPRHGQVARRRRRGRHCSVAAHPLARRLCSRAPVRHQECRQRNYFFGRCCQA